MTNSLTYVAGSIVTESLEPLQAAALRGIGVVMILILFFRRYLLPNRVIAPFAFLGLFGVIGNQGFFFWGSKYTTPAHASLIYAFSPVIVLILGRMARQEWLSFRKMSGIMLSIAGIVWVLGIADSFDPAYIRGDMILLAGTLSWSLYTVLGKTVMQKYGAIRTTLNSLLWGGLLFFFIGFSSLWDVEFAHVSLKTWGWLTYMMVFTSIISYLIWYTVIHRMDSSRASVFMNLQFPVTVIFSGLITGENVGIDLLIGAFLVISGVVIATYNGLALHPAMKSADACDGVF